MKKIILLLMIVVFIGGCSYKVNTNEFKKMYDVDTTNVKSMNEKEFIELTKEKTGVVFIGDDSKESKSLAKIFVNNLCECDVNKAHFVKKDVISTDKLASTLGKDEIKYPVVVAYKVGEMVGYYDANTDTTDVNKYIYDLILSAYPNVCTDAC